MATRVGHAAVIDGERRFFFIMACAMALVLSAGFSIQLAAGRSSFNAPVFVHVHGLLFFGWTVLYVIQNGLVATGSVALHRRLGWLAAIWVPLMIVVGITATTLMVRAGRAPFFFLPLRFLVMNSITVLFFAGLAGTAIALRRRAHWHKRLMYCGMALLTGPGFGRLLPMPFMIPWADWGVFAAILIWPLIGIIADLRRTGVVHRAWWVGLAVIVAGQLSIGPVSESRLGATIYDAVTAGGPGARIAALAYPPMPPL